MTSRPERLSSREFDAAFASARSLRGPLLTLRVHWRREDGKTLRAAFVVPKKLGKATWRNRTRRRMREAFRLQGEGLQALARSSGGCDCIFLAQPGAHDAPFEALQQAIHALLWRAVEERRKQHARTA